MLRHLDMMTVADSEAHQQYYETRLGLAQEGGEPPSGAKLAMEVAKMAAALLRGLRWTLHYYLLGVPSWHWFYPYHHAPLLCDVAALLALAPATATAPWPQSRPLKPFEQLLSVLPPASASLLPGPYRDLLLAASTPGSDHALAKFFPHEYKIEPDPKGDAQAGSDLCTRAYMRVRVACVRRV